MKGRIKEQGEKYHYRCIINIILVYVIYLIFIYVCINKNTLYFYIYIYVIKCCKTLYLI